MDRIRGEPRRRRSGVRLASILLYAGRAAALNAAPQETRRQRGPMRQIALGMLLTAVAVSASAQTPTTPSSNGALQGVTLSTPVLAASATPAAPAQAPAPAADGFVNFL